MKVLIIGGNAREHAIAWKIHKDNPNVQLYCTEKNAGIQSICKCLSIPHIDISNTLNFALEEHLVGFDNNYIHCYL